MSTVEWVFGGVGVAVPLAIIGWLLQRRTRRSSGRPSQSIRSGDRSVNVQSEGDVAIRDINKP